MHDAKPPRIIASAKGCIKTNKGHMILGSQASVRQGSKDSLIVMVLEHWHRLLCL